MVLAIRDSRAGEERIARACARSRRSSIRTTPTRSASASITINAVRRPLQRQGVAAAFAAHSTWSRPPSTQLAARPDAGTGAAPPWWSWNYANALLIVGRTDRGDDLLREGRLRAPRPAVARCREARHNYATVINDRLCTLIEGQGLPQGGRGPAANHDACAPTRCAWATSRSPYGNSIDRRAECRRFSVLAISHSRAASPSSTRATRACKDALAKRISREPPPVLGAMNRAALRRPKARGARIARRRPA